MLELTENGHTLGRGCQMNALGAVRAAVVGTAFVVATGCATAINYDGPSPPIFIGQRTLGVREGTDLRLVTFNIKFGEQIDRAAGLLSRPGPLRDADVLVLQELDVAGTERLAYALGMNYVYVPSAIHPSSHRQFGVAVLSPWPIEEARNLLLPHPHRVRKMQRRAAAATIDTPIGRLLVYAVHLETLYGASSRARRDQARAVLEDTSGWDGPIVIAGDFNGTSGADELQKHGFLWLTRRVHNTDWLFDFDHILVRGLCAAADPPAAKGPDAHGISDHRPVWAVVRPCAP